MDMPPLSLINEHIIVIDVFTDFIYIDYDDENGYADDWAILKKISKKVTYWQFFKSLQMTNSDTVMFYCLLCSDRIVYKGHHAVS